MTVFVFRKKKKITFAVNTKTFRTKCHGVEFTQNNNQLKVESCLYILESFEFSLCCYIRRGCCIKELFFVCQPVNVNEWPIVGILNPIKGNLIDRSLLYY